MNHRRKHFELPYWSPNDFVDLNHCSTDFVTALMSADIFHYQCCYHIESCAVEAQQSTSENTSLRLNFSDWSFSLKNFSNFMFLHNNNFSSFCYFSFNSFLVVLEMSKGTFTHNCKNQEYLVQFRLVTSTVAR